MKYRLYWRILLTAIPVGVLAYSFWHWEQPSLHISQPAGKANLYASEWLPAERTLLTENSTGTQQFRRLLGEPVYIELKPQRHYKTVQVAMRYDNFKQGQLVAVSLGLQQKDGSYQLKPVHNQYLEEITLDPDWDSADTDRPFLFQRKSAKQFATLDDFLAELPQNKKIATLNYNLSSYFRLPNYTPSATRQRIINSLRGSHTIVTYIKNEALDFNFELQDVNRRDGIDETTLQVFKDDKIIYDEKLPDDGYDGRFGPVTARRSIPVRLTDLPEGAYKLVIKANDDIFIREIDTVQSKLVFSNSLYLTDNQEYKPEFSDLLTGPIELFSNVNRLGFYTAHHRGLQKFNIGGKEVDLNQTHIVRQVDVQMSPDATYYFVKSPKNDVRLTGRGYFALVRSAFFDPDFISLEAEGLDLSKVDYVVADYRFPLKSIAVTQFDIPADLQKLRFIISAPGVSQSKPFDIYNIDYTLLR